MYNLQTKNKRQGQENKQRLKAISLKKFVETYYQKERPQLLNNHNKRVNDFIRKLQHEPIIVKLDPYQSNDNKKKLIKFRNPKNYLQSKGRKIQSKSTMSHKNSIGNYDDDQEQVIYESFKFKNSQDWTSLFTPWQRLQRQKNYKVFKQKYGDPSIAFRSIGSQSQYHPYHDFRARNQNLQINPPMKYTTKPTQQILANMKSKYKKNKNKQHNYHPNKTHQIKAFDTQKLLIKSSAQSAMGNDENFIVENLITENNESYFGNKDSQAHDNGDRKQVKAKKKQQKVYFKEIVQFQQNTGDQKSKKLLRQILTKCGVYRKKNRRAVTDTDIDQFDNLANSNHS